MRHGVCVCEPKAPFFSPGDDTTVTRCVRTGAIIIIILIIMFT